MVRYLPTQAKYAYRKILMLINRRALAPQNLYQNTLSLMVGTLTVGVCSERRIAEMHNPAPCPHITRRVCSGPASSSSSSSHKGDPHGYTYDRSTLKMMARIFSESYHVSYGG
ncbi:hypothetical protein CHARACLAT_011416 [Characodon lateralis]|uniref:Uncharacterized protein n=1 Tax=Characodon lateralis TaxID=208331 RepID=A0ABU7D8P5_9TELE|nr:hypothetical protein [Characodon lateralis]